MNNVFRNRPFDGSQELNYNFTVAESFNLMKVKEFVDLREKSRGKGYTRATGIYRP
jgi:hypothetical protein